MANEKSTETQIFIRYGWVLGGILPVMLIAIIVNNAQANNELSKNIATNEIATNEIATNESYSKKDDKSAQHFFSICLLYVGISAIVVLYGYGGNRPWILLFGAIITLSYLCYAIWATGGMSHSPFAFTIVYLAGVVSWYLNQSHRDSKQLWESPALQSAVFCIICLLIVLVDWGLTPWLSELFPNVRDTILSSYWEKKHQSGDYIYVVTIAIQLIAAWRVNSARALEAR